MSWRLGVLAVLILSNAATAQPTPLNSSVLIFDEATLRRAPTLVDRAADLGNTRVMIVVTMHCRLTPELKVTEYGMVGDRRLQWRAPLHPGNFLPVNDRRRQAFGVALAAVFRRAVARGMDLAVLPHLDAYGEVTEWRNHFDFDPLERHGKNGSTGESYETAVLSPIVDALLAARGPETHVLFSLAGEMGRSVFKHAAYYDEIARYVRRRLSGPGGGAGRVAVGVSLNHNDVAGGHALDAAGRSALQRLVSGCDFVGLSHYRPFEPPVRERQFVEACDAFLAALGRHGVSLPEATPLHFSEVALGGAPPKRGEPTPALAAAQPWEGTGDADRSPWRSGPMLALRRAYHRELLGFLNTQPGPRRVSAAYLWSEGSWDPQGLGGPAFADQAIIDAIRRHNAIAAPRTVTDADHR